MNSPAQRTDSDGDSLAAPRRLGLFRRFESGLEAEDRAFQDAAQVKRIRGALGAAVVVLFGCTVLGLFVAPKPIMGEVVALRLSLMVMPLLLLLAASYRQQWRSILHHIAGAACRLCAALGAVTLVVRSRYQGLPLDYEGVLLVLMYMYGC